MGAEQKVILWPGWETTRLIGRGSFGAVYEIERRLFEDEEPEKSALKVITIPQNDSDIEEMYNDGYDEESVTTTFRAHLKSIVSEYSLMRKMNGSANIVNCDDVRYVQHEDGVGWDIFIKMELLTSLAKVLPEAIPEAQVLRVAEDMCSALELCAKHNIVHRDIKPQNIFVSENGDYKLGDFGIAKTVEKTMGGTKTGTYKYMAPEVYSNKPYNNTADIYSLGLVLYWMLNERRMPFMPLPPEKLNVGTDEESRNRRFSGEAIPAPKNGSKELKRIVLKACAFDPRDRYQSAREMREDVVRLSRGYAAEPPQDFIPVPDNHGDSDDHTVGPVFNPAPVMEAEGFDQTVGPIFTPVKEDPNKGNAPEPSPAANYGAEGKKRRGVKAFAVVAVLLAVCAVCMFLLFGQGADNKNDLTEGEPTTATEETIAVPVIDTPIDLRGRMATGGYHTSLNLEFYYGFYAIVDQNHNLYLRSYDTDHPESNIIYETGICNVVSVYVGYFDYDPAYELYMPTLYYLNTQGEIWTAKMIPGERWTIGTPERYGKWTNICQIYAGVTILPGLVILQDSGDLYVGDIKIPVPYVVDVECYFDSIMFRTADGTCYVAGTNDYGTFVESTADTIPFTEPEQLLIPTDVEDACVVRAVENGSQTMYVATLDEGAVCIFDAQGNCVYYENGYTSAIISAADGQLYIIYEDGPLHYFGGAGYGSHQVSEIMIDGMNKIMGIASTSGTVYQAVDRDGKVWFSHGGPLYYENGEEFRYTHGETQSILGPTMTPEVLDARVAELVALAQTWTDKTAPQTIEEFPFMPASVLEIFQIAQSADTEITVDGTTITYKSTLPKMLSGTVPNMEYSYFFDWCDQNDNGYYINRTELEMAETGVFTAQIPEVDWADTNDNFNVGICGENRLGKCREILEVKYYAVNIANEQAKNIGIVAYTDENRIQWFYNTDTQEIGIYIGTATDGIHCFLYYSALTGEFARIERY